ncbi:trissin [Haemaphysalis longicornis]
MTAHLGRILVSASCATVLLLSALLPGGEASRACNACGPECVTACGTAMFRACCFNYNRKRSGSGASAGGASAGGGGSELRDVAVSGGGSNNLESADSATYEGRGEAYGAPGSAMRQDSWALFWMLPARQRQAALFK